MKKKTILITLLFLFIIFFLVTNFTILNWYLPQSYPHRYCSDQCGFWTWEKAKGRDPVGDVEIWFEEYKKKVEKPNLVLHRRFKRKWWQVWNWVDFMTNRRWDIPYAEKDEDT